MGTRGPRPKPTNMKLLQGTYRADRASSNEPAPPPAVPSCPSFLKGEARREWKRISKDLATLGLLTRIDRAALAGYCTAWETYVESDKEVRLNGRTTTTDKGNLVQHPELANRNRALEMMKAFLAEFGMTPASRTRIHVPEKRAVEENPFAALGG